MSENQPQLIAEQVQVESSGQTAPQAISETSEVVKKQTYGVRSVKMTISRIDPLSTLKICFLVSVAIGIMLVVAAIVLWFVFDAMYVWSSIDDFVRTLDNAAMAQLVQFLEFGRIIPFMIVVAVLQIIMFTLLGGIFALVFNVVAMLVGGFKMTVTDE